MKELSPTARAVFESFNSQFDWVEDGVPGPQFKAIAAALLTAAEQIVLPKYQYADWEMADLIMQEIQAIADELEAQ